VKIPILQLRNEKVNTLTSTTKERFPILFLARTARTDDRLEEEEEEEATISLPRTVETISSLLDLLGRRRSLGVVASLPRLRRRRRNEESRCQHLRTLELILDSEAMEEK